MAHAIAAALHDLADACVANAVPRTKDGLFLGTVCAVEPDPLLADWSRIHVAFLGQPEVAAMFSRPTWEVAAFTVGQEIGFALTLA
jgi:hypothetical protein